MKIVFRKPRIFGAFYIQLRRDSFSLKTYFLSAPPSYPAKKRKSFRAYETPRSKDKVRFLPVRAKRKKFRKSLDKRILLCYI